MRQHLLLLGIRPSARLEAPCRCFPENSGDFGIVLMATLVEAVERNVLVHEGPKISGRSIAGHKRISDEFTVL